MYFIWNYFDRKPNLFSFSLFSLSSVLHHIIAETLSSSSRMQTYNTHCKQTLDDVHCHKVLEGSLAYEGCGSEISICLRDIQNILNDSKLAFARNEQQLDLLCR